MGGEVISSFQNKLSTLKLEFDLITAANKMGNSDNCGIIFLFSPLKYIL